MESLKITFGIHLRMVEGKAPKYMSVLNNAGVPLSVMKMICCTFDFELIQCWKEIYKEV